MNPNDVIDAYVADVMRRLPRKDRHEVGMELRGLLGEMLADRPRADDDSVLAMLREFGTPMEVAARYRPPGMVIIPAEQSRSFALISLAGVGLQWALTLPRVFHGQPLASWWFTWGLGSLWWPGFLAMMTLAAAWLRHVGAASWFGASDAGWRPRTIDPERVDRGLLGVTMASIAIGIAVMVALPWITPSMPAPMPTLFAFAPDFLRVRAWPALVLWLAQFALLAVLMVKGRWSPALRWGDVGFNVAWLALLGAWLAGGPIFQSASVEGGARNGLGLVMAFIAIDLVMKLYRRRTSRPRLSR